MSDQMVVQPRKRGHVRMFLLGGLVALIAAVGVDAWVMGYLKPKPKVALVTWNQNPYWDQTIAGAQDAARTQNLDLVVVRSEPDEKSQTQHIRDLLDQGVKGIAICPNNPKGQLDVLNEAAGKTLLVTFDSDAEVSKRKAFVGTDNYAAGNLAAEQVRAAVPDGGEVIITVGSVGMDNARQRRQGILDNLLGHAPKVDQPIDTPLKGDKYSIIATLVDAGDLTKATSNIADAIKAHPDVKCIVGLFSYSGPAAVNAIKQAGKPSQIKVIAFDESDATQAGIADGSIYSSILQDQYYCGYHVIHVMDDCLRGLDTSAPETARVVLMPPRLMTKDNLAELRSQHAVHTPK